MKDVLSTKAGEVQIESFAKQLKKTEKFRFLKGELSTCAYFSAYTASQRQLFIEDDTLQENLKVLLGVRRTDTVKLSDMIISGILLYVVQSKRMLDFFDVVHSELANFKTHLAASIEELVDLVTFNFVNDGALRGRFGADLSIGCALEFNGKTVDLTITIRSTTTWISNLELVVMGACEADFPKINKSTSHSFMFDRAMIEAVR